MPLTSCLLLYIIFPFGFYLLGGILATFFRCKDVTYPRGPWDGFRLELHCPGYENWQAPIESLLDFGLLNIFTIYTGLIALALLIIIQVILLGIKSFLR